MAVIVADFKEPVVGPDGVACHARACGVSRGSGQWQGWIEFNPLNGSPTFRSPYETVQPSSRELREWADDLTPSWLEGALLRALNRLCRTPNQSPALVSPNRDVVGACLAAAERHTG